MAKSNENKRLGREKELRRKMRDCMDRFESVFGKPLSTGIILEFLDESEKHNRLTFLKDRIGLLSDWDVEYIRTVLKAASKSPELVPDIEDAESDEGDDDQVELDLEDESAFV